MPDCRKSDIRHIWTEKREGRKKVLQIVCAVIGTVD